ncbi:MAG: amidase family protein [Chloroflexota bacterium]
MKFSDRIAESIVRVAGLLIVCLGAATSVANADGRYSTGYFAERVITTLTAEQALAAMDRGFITSEQYVRILLRRIERYPELNALVHVNRHAAIASAREADRERAAGVSKPLLGLPVVIKDSFNTADLPTTVGTPSLLGFQPDSNAAIVDALLEAGAIILAKGNLHELQAGFLTNNPSLGVAYNPYGRGLSPGGSSGGNAAAVSARLAPLAIGADTAGSIRAPAALTGTTGFRPTSGRYRMDGIAPLAPTFDSAGPMARSVRDLALADAVITGDSIKLDAINLKGLRIGVPRGFFRLAVVYCRLNSDETYEVLNRW